MANGNSSLCQIAEAKAEPASIEPSLAWQNLHYSVAEWPFKKKTLLRNLSGLFEVATLNGLMGPSGAGKTTLLNCLRGTGAGHLSAPSALYLNSNRSEEGPLSYFIEQHVHQSIVGQLTVNQILMYAFNFKNGPSHSSDEMKVYIQQTLAQLLLDDSILSRPFERCSGGGNRSGSPLPRS